MDDIIEPVYISIAGAPDDPRTPRDLPSWVVPRYVPPFHPDDVCVVDGIPTTSPSRTLIDCAEIVSDEELLEMFLRARALGLLDYAALEASLARMEWRPYLADFRAFVDAFRAFEEAAGMG